MSDDPLTLAEPLPPTLEALRRRGPMTSLAVQGHHFDVLRTGGAGLGAPAVLWLHGAQGTPEVFHRPLMATLERFDHVALGFPPLADAPTLASLVIAAADALGLQAFSVVGTSYGGYLALWVAQLAPRRVRHVIAGNTFADPTPLQSPEKRTALESRDPQSLKDEVLGRLKGSPPSELRTTLLELVGRGTPPEVLHARMLAVQTAVALPAAPAIDDARVLLLECDDDPLIPPPLRAALRARHPHARVVAWPTGGHYPYLTRADAYGETVAAFLGAGDAR